MDVLTPIPHVLWVHEQSLTSLGHTQYTRILFIQASKHPSCVARFGKNCKTTKLFSGWCMLLSESQQAMDMLPIIPNYLWVHVQGLTSLK